MPLIRSQAWKKQELCTVIYRIQPLFTKHGKTLMLKSLQNICATFSLIMDNYETGSSGAIFKNQHLPPQVFTIVLTLYCVYTQLNVEQELPSESFTQNYNRNGAQWNWGEKKRAEGILKEEIKSLSNIYKNESMLLYDNINQFFMAFLPCFWGQDYLRQP